MGLLLWFTAVLALEEQVWSKTFLDIFGLFAFILSSGTFCTLDIAIRKFEDIGKVDVRKTGKE